MNWDDPAVAEQENVTPDQQEDSSETPKGSLPRPEDSNSTSVNGAVTADSPLSERLDSLFGYDPYGGRTPESPLIRKASRRTCPRTRVTSIVLWNCPRLRSVGKYSAIIGDFPLTVEKHGTWADTVDEHSDAVSIRPQELKPLGEYLNALHYTIERNQK